MQRKIPFKEAMPAAPTHVFSATTLTIVLSITPPGLLPIPRRAAKNQCSVGKLLELFRVTIRNEEVDAVLRHDNAKFILRFDDERTEHDVIGHCERNRMRRHNAPMRKWNRHHTALDVLVQPPARVHAAKPPVQRDVLLGLGRSEERRV